MPEGAKVRGSKHKEEKQSKGNTVKEREQRNIMNRIDRREETEYPKVHREIKRAGRR